MPLADQGAAPEMPLARPLVEPDGAVELPGGVAVPPEPGATATRHPAAGLAPIRSPVPRSRHPQAERSASSAADSSPRPRSASAERSRRGPAGPAGSGRGIAAGIEEAGRGNGKLGPAGSRRRSRAGLGPGEQGLAHPPGLEGRTVLDQQPAALLEKGTPAPPPRRPPRRARTRDGTGPSEPGRTPARRRRRTGHCRPVPGPGRQPPAPAPCARDRRSAHGRRDSQAADGSGCGGPRRPEAHPGTAVPPRRRRGALPRLLTPARQDLPLEARRERPGQSGGRGPRGRGVHGVAHEARYHRRPSQVQPQPITWPDSMASMAAAAGAGATCSWAW